MGRNGGAKGRGGGGRRKGFRFVCRSRLLAWRLERTDAYFYPGSRRAMFAGPMTHNTVQTN